MESLSQYHIFYTVAKNGSISAAANELFISQPAVSKSIKKLEELLQTTLLIRGSRAGWKRGSHGCNVRPPRP